MRQASYKRILLKVSGESLKGSGSYGIEPAAVNYLAQQISQAHNMGVEVAVVVEAETSGAAHQQNLKEWTGQPPTTPECWLQ